MENHQAVVPVHGELVFGTTAIYRTDLSRELQTIIDHGMHRVQDLTKQFDAVRVELELLKEFDPGLESFINVNCQRDYESLLKRFT